VDPDHKLLMIVVTPQNQLVELDLGTGGTQLFKATGKYMDGMDEDLSGKVVWATDPPGVLGAFGSPVGTLNLTPFSTAGSKTATITASFEGKVGKAAFTVVSYVKSGTKPDFFFLLPYMDPAGPTAPKPLEFKTNVQNMDVFFNMDTTGSMSGSISNLKSDVISQIVTPMKLSNPTMQFGVGEYRDFPVGNYGSAGDYPFKLLQKITSDNALVSTAVGKYVHGGGNDDAESLIEALYQIATGDGFPGYAGYPASGIVPPNKEGRGGAGFRPDSIPIIVSITDVCSHGIGEPECSAAWGGINYSGTLASYAHSRAQAKAGLKAMCGRAVGVDTMEAAASSMWDCHRPLADLEDFAKATGAVIPTTAWNPAENNGVARPAGCASGQCCTNLNGTGRPATATNWVGDGTNWCPLVFRTYYNGTGLGQAIRSGLEMLTRYANFEVLSVKAGVTTGVYGEPVPSGKTTADFIVSITPSHYVKPAPPPTIPNPITGTTSFQRVTPGTNVWFNVVAYNNIVPATNVAQYFKATISVTAESCFPLDGREVLIVVPPRPLEVPW